MFLLCPLTVVGQIDSTQNDTHIFWNDGYQLQMSDFASLSDTEKRVNACEKINLCWGAATGLFSALDVPKKKKDAAYLYEVVYFVPAFEKAMSYKLNNDSLQFLKQVIVFDMFELAARFARKEMSELFDSVSDKAIGLQAIFFKSVETSANDFLDNLFSSYTKDVYVNNRDGAYKEWRLKIDQELKASDEFRTTKLDCYRFVSGKPLDSRYKQAKKVVGDLFEE